MECFVSGVGLAGDGLPDWSSGRGQLLTGRLVPGHELGNPPGPAILPANERRRTTPIIKLALQVAAEAVADQPGGASGIATVFASADGDGQVVHRICEALHLPGQPVSPTDFHNSVHNAPAAYWSFCTGSRAASTSVAGGDHSFVLGLLEAFTQLDADEAGVLLVAYDRPMPAPLAQARPLRGPFAVALLLTRERLPVSLAGLRLSTSAAAPPTTCAPPLESLRRGIPAGRALPLLQALAERRPAEILFEYPAAFSPRLTVAPC